jgi:3-oxoacyl-[acyl-carrier protein] reductase
MMATLMEEGMVQAQTPEIIVTVNTVSPALIETDMLEKIAANRERIPVGRFGLAEEVADVVVMLVRNGYITGQTINVNGGMYFS